MILAALQSGKHVYSEWPLGAVERETEEICKAADAANVHTAIGLQLRGSPTVKRARDLLEGGAIGRLLLSLVAFAIVAVALLLGLSVSLIVYPAALIGASPSAARLPCCRPPRPTPPGADADLAQSMIVTVWNSAIAGGGVFGGLLLQAFGPTSFAPAVLLLALAAVAIAWISSAAGFTPGPRANQA